MIDIKAIKTRASESDANGWSTSVESNDTVIALCDEVERLLLQLAIYEKHGVTCQTFGHKLTGCAECNRDDAADDEMALDTLNLQARQYFELLPEIERLRKDAARYQALRSSGHMAPEVFDQEVDAAMEISTASQERRMSKLPDPVAWHYERDTDIALSFSPDRDDLKHWQPMYSEAQVKELLAKADKQKARDIMAVHTQMVDKYDPVLKQALEALTRWKNANTFSGRINAQKPGVDAIDAIRKVLA